MKNPMNKFLNPDFLINFMKYLFYSIFGFFFILSAPGFAKDEGPSTQVLSEISSRGRDLYEYDLAAWIGTDAIMKLAPDENLVSHYLILKNAEGYKVYFGKLDGDAFAVFYSAEIGRDFKVRKKKRYEAPQRESGLPLAMARALELAKADLPALDGPYNTMVVPFLDQILVYFVPASEEEGYYRLGKDFRYKVSSDGSKILEKTKLHESLINTPPPPPGVEAGYHSLVLTDIPTETDVLYVMLRKPKLPEFVNSKKYSFLISPDGSIKFLGPAKSGAKKGN